MRKEFEMTQAQLDTILDACKPTPVMYLSGGIPMGGTPQENANRAWKLLAEEKGFVWDSVKPISGKGNLFFTAEEAPKELGEAVEHPATNAGCNGQAI